MKKILSKLTEQDKFIIQTLSSRYHFFKSLLDKKFKYWCPKSLEARRIPTDLLKILSKEKLYEKDVIVADNSFYKLSKKGKKLLKLINKEA